MNTKVITDSKGKKIAITPKSCLWCVDTDLEKLSHYRILRVDSFGFVVCFNFLSIPLYDINKFSLKKFSEYSSIKFICEIGGRVYFTDEKVANKILAIILKRKLEYQINKSEEFKEAYFKSIDVVGKYEQKIIDQNSKLKLLQKKK